MKMKKFFIPTLIILCLVACKPTLDASSKQAMKTSADKIRETLPSEKQNQFDEAMIVIIMSVAEQESLRNTDIDNIDGILKKTSRCY